MRRNRSNPTPYPDVSDRMPFPIAELQRRLGRKSYGKVHRIITGLDKCPADVAPAIESATAGAIKRGDLRPDLWPDHQSPSAAA